MVIQKYMRDTYSQRNEDVLGGGGPSGEDSAGWYGGGGSGNVVHQAIQMLGRSSNQFWIKVGSGGKRGKGGKDSTIDWGLTSAYFRAQGMVQ